MKLGPYEVLGELGRGGMGVVLRGRAPSGEEVALKLLLRVDAETLARFDRERRLLGRFTARDGFVPLLDAGASPEGTYLVMPLLRGGTLRDRLRGPLGIEEAVRVMSAVAEALGRAHERGIVHRDLKPENVLFDGKGRPLVADLGLAKHFDREASGASQSVSLSRSGDMRGTAGYMAPEQIASASSVGPRSDVFALGAVLYECLAGSPAFSGANTLEVLARISSGSFEPLRRVRGETPPWLVAVVEKALATDPARRFGDGSELARALRGKRGGTSRRGVGLALVALAVAAALVAFARPEPPPPFSGKGAVYAKPGPEPGLPAGLRTGDGRVFLWRLPANAGDLELVHVPAGDFVMGSEDPDGFASERPRHVHHMPRDYWIARTDVTWTQYLAYCEATGAAPPERPEWGGDDHPVVNVSWHEAKAYCSWANLALPSEAQWEKAARGAEGRKYPWGNDWPPASGSARANFADRNAPATTPLRTGDVLTLTRDEDADDGWAYTSPAGS